MKTRLQQIILGLMLFASTTAPCWAAVNVLADGDVEDGRIPSSSFIPGWLRAGGWQVAPGEGVNGTQCLKVTVAAGQTQTHNVNNAYYYSDPGDTLTLKLAYKTSADFNNQGQINDNRILLRCYDGSHGLIGTRLIRIQLEPTNSQWVTAQDTAVTPSGTYYFDVTIMAGWDGYSTGTLWVDNVEVYQTFGTTPTEGTVYWEGVSGNPDPANWNVGNNWSVATQGGLKRPPVPGDIVIVANHNLNTVSPVIDGEVFGATALGIGWHAGTYPSKKLYITNGALVNISAWTRLGNEAGSTGRLFMNGGVLNTGSLFLGNDAENTNGVGIFYQTGGQVNLSAGMYIAPTNPANRYYFGNSAVLTMPGNQTAGIPAWLKSPFGWMWNFSYDSGSNKTTATVSYQPVTTAPGASYYWNGTNSNAWTLGSNWSGGLVPGTAGAPSLAIISSNGSPNYPLIDTDLVSAGTSPAYIAFNWHDTCPASTASLTIGTNGFAACSGVFFNRDNGSPASQNPGDALLTIQDGGRMVTTDLMMSENPDSIARIVIGGGSFLHCGNPIVWGNGDHQINIKSGGHLYFNGDITTTIQQWITEGKIVGNDGQSQLLVSYGTPIAELTAVYPNAAPCSTFLEGDVDLNCQVNLNDLMLLISEWLQPPYTNWQAEMNVDPVTLPNFYRRSELAYADDYEINGGLMIFNSTSPAQKGNINVLVDTYPPQIFNKTVEIWASLRTTELGDSSPAVHSPCIFVPINSDQTPFGMARFMMVQPNSNRQDLVVVVNENTELMRLSGFDPSKLVTINAVVDATGETKTVLVKSASDGTTTYTNQLASFTNGIAGPAAGPTFVSLAGFGYSAEVDYLYISVDRMMAYDLTNDNEVDLADFAKIAADWLDNSYDD